MAQVLTIQAPPPVFPREAAVIHSAEDPRLHPKLRALWQFWNALRGARPAPRIDEIHALVLKPWLGNVLLLDVIDGGSDFRYRVYGSIAAEQFGFDLTGRLVGDCVDLIGPIPFREYRRVVEKGRPEAVARASPAARDFLLLDKLSLPLAASDNGRVARILAGLYASEPERSA